mmetsp:Transcript_29597/g.77642  ORF Transcript_29597/g.77642 Transcript_29597/m.77642 type:complete len:263 (-) Transcript_29597:1092-1880(-)
MHGRQRHSTSSEAGPHTETPSPEPSKKVAKSPAGKTPSKKKARVARPMNSFMIFAREFRAEMRERHPNIDNKDISKMLGKEWKTLSADKKKTYYDKAAAVAEQHKKDHPDWKFVRAPPRKGKSKKAETLSPSGRKPRSPSSAKKAGADSEGAFYSPPPAIAADGQWEQERKPSTLQPGHLESLRDLQVAQSRLMLEQQEMEIAVMMAQKPESPQMPPPRYVAPPPLKADSAPHHGSIFLSAMELAMMANAPSAVTPPSVHPV